MRTVALAIGAATIALTAVPAEARHYSNVVKCTKYRHGQCVKRARLTRHQARQAAYKVGYRFGPTYSYVPVTQLPQPVVTQYSLTPDYRYVYRDHYIYVVDPKTYAITRVIDALTH